MESRYLEKGPLVVFLGRISGLAFVEWVFGPPFSITPSFQVVGHLNDSLFSVLWPH